MVDFKDYTRKMERTLEVLQEEFGAVRAGRANARVLDRISVEYYGSETPIGQVASISSPDPRTLVIQPWDNSLLRAIEKAIQQSDLGINPQNDGRIPQGADQAGQEVRRGFQGRHAQCPPRRHGLYQVPQEKERNHRGRAEKGRKGPSGAYG